MLAGWAFRIQLMSWFGLLRREVHAAQAVREAKVRARGLSQPCVFRLGFVQNGDIGVGVFPEGEEILIGGAGRPRGTSRSGGGESWGLPIESVDFPDAGVTGKQRGIVRGEAAPSPEISYGGLKPFQAEDPL